MEERPSRDAGALERRHGERRREDRRAWPRPVAVRADGPSHGHVVPRILSRGLRRITEAPLVPGNAAELLVDAPVAYPAMLKLIAEARHSIGFENYIIRDDDVGREFARALAERARAGVKVRVLYDWFGSFKTAASHWKHLVEAGCEVRSFGAPVFPKPFRIFTRDHRKLLVVDGRSAIVGGFCVGGEWLDDGGLGCWRDTGVRVEGPVAQAIEAAFARMWRRAGGDMPCPEGPVPEPVGDVAIRVVDGPPAHARAYRLYQLLSALAERTLYVTGAYPLAPAPLRRALASAARAGVDVRLLVPSRSDLRLLNQAARAHYATLLKAGVRIYLWNGPMLHAKTLVVDGMIALIGSSNLNPWSLMGCYELDLQLEDGGVAAALEKQFLRDVQRARELTLADWRHRPAAERWKERLGAGLLWLPYKLYSG
ncbi:MAG TPA: phospholipase D-like domain-containing protein [Longimicrobiales bacterium]|nr:phospholipase D-like domain-containing protein [Longimicrobiales bacterium]